MNRRGHASSCDLVRYATSDEICDCCPCTCGASQAQKGDAGMNRRGHRGRVDSNHATSPAGGRVCGCGGPKDFYAKRCAKCAGWNGAASVTATCAACGKQWKVKPSHAHKRRYCSRQCMATGYARRMVGAANPNYSDAARRVCVGCGAEYASYQKDSKFCTKQCHVECDRACRRAMRRKARKDMNHDQICEVFKKLGWLVQDTSLLGGGFPDIIIGHPVHGVHLVEIKNPKSNYGRAGLNKHQRRFAEEWASAGIHVVRTEDDVLAVVKKCSKSDES